MSRLRRSAAMVGLVQVLLLASASASHAEERPPPEGTEGVQVVSGHFDAGELGLAGITAVPTSGAGAQAEPPPTCDLNNVGGDYDASYLNGVLTHVDWRFYGSLNCPPASPGQEMRELWTQATLNHDITEAGRGSEDRCTDQDPFFCTSVASWGTHTCGAGPACAGTWQVLNFMELILPAGYVWSYWPETCSAIFPDDLLCYTYTEVAYISPTYP